LRYLPIGVSLVLIGPSLQIFNSAAINAQRKKTRKSPCFSKIAYDFASMALFSTKQKKVLTESISGSTNN